MKIRLFTLPNLFTLLNLFCGSMAVVFILHYGNLQLAFWFMILAAVFDFFDGFIARLLKMSSEVGKQLDSLADMVSFGLVPALFLYSMYIGLGGLDWWAYGVYVVFVLAMFSALRLAKFNIDEEQREEFVGLNTPACAILVGSTAYLFESGVVSFAPFWVLIATLVLSWLLISPIRMFSLKFKNLSFSDNALRYIFLIVSIVGVAVFRMKAVPFVIILYILVSTVRHIVTPKRAN